MSSWSRKRTLAPTCSQSLGEGLVRLIRYGRALTDADLDKTITIRGEPHTVYQALLRGLTHTTYHIGQILFLARLSQPGSKWLTVPPGQSRTYTGKYRSK